jgi:hypothetical protein
MKTPLALLAALIAVFLLTGCVSSGQTGARVDMNDREVATAGLANNSLRATPEQTQLTGMDPVDYVNTEYFDSASNFPEATSIIDLGDGRRLIMNDTGDMSAESIEITADGGVAIAGLTRSMTDQITAQGTLRQSAVDYFTSLPAEQTEQFIRWMDANEAWTEVFGDVTANAIRALLGLPPLSGGGE